MLLSLDRLRGIELVMTQELIANMLGVRREGATGGALKLQEAKLIRYARGRIKVQLADDPARRETNRDLHNLDGSSGTRAIERTTAATR